MTRLEQQGEQGEHGERRRYRERLSPVEGHRPVSLLGAPLVELLGVPDHHVLVESRVVMQSHAGLVAEIHVKPAGTHRRVRESPG